MICTLVACLALSDLPSTGTAPDAFEAVDTLVVNAADVFGATAASFCVFDRDGNEVAARAYGWFDRGKRRRTVSEDTFRLASNTKPFTAATVRELIAEGVLSRDMRMLDALKLDTSTKLADARVRDVTIQHLLDHKGGWDRTKSFDPMYSLPKIAGRRKEWQLEPRDVINYMLDKPLQHAPGEQYAYANFGFLVLGEVIEVQTGQPFIEVVHEKVTKPLGIEDLEVSHRLENRRPAAEVDYPAKTDRPMRIRQASGGLTSSSRSLCKFMTRYWISGERKQPGQRRQYFHFGSLPETTNCMMVQRLDGVLWAACFNSRREDTYAEDLSKLRADIDEALNDVLFKRPTEEVR